MKFWLRTVENRLRTGTKPLRTGTDGSGSGSKFCRTKPLVLAPVRQILAETGPNRTAAALVQPTSFEVLVTFHPPWLGMTHFTSSKAVCYVSRQFYSQLGWLKIACKKMHCRIFEKWIFRTVAYLAGRFRWSVVYATHIEPGKMQIFLTIYF